MEKQGECIFILMDNHKLFGLFKIIQELESSPLLYFAF